MKKITGAIHLEDMIALLRSKAQEKFLSVREIITIFSGKGRSLLLILLILPFCQPLQIPGLSIPFALAISLIGLRMIFGKHIWLPTKLLDKTIASPFLLKITDKALPIIKKVQRWTHPRLDWVCGYRFTQIVNGLLIFTLGILLALPLPIPFSNLSAAWSIFFLSLGLLEDDGLFVLIGYFISLATLLFFLYLFFQMQKIF